MSKVRFNYADIKPGVVKRKREIQIIVEGVFTEEEKLLKKIDYIFCSDEYLLKINQSFLNHGDYTDIITFDLSEGEAVTGEIYISVERVKENATIHNVSFEEETARVVFHGALHLCGYGDKKKSEITRMRQKEDYYLRMLSQKI